MARDGISSVTKKECSINLYNANGTCTKCPKGTKGKNCSEKCQANMYGELCLEKCNCQPHQECNNIHGCIVAETSGICSNNESPDVICCDNFMLSNGHCKACPLGTFWTNCSLECPDGYYGMFCKEKCDCKTSECDKAVGCPKKDTLGICSNKESPGVICCDNFMLSNGHCKACPSGTFWTNCSLECPDGYYGMFCKEKCDCKTSECDKAVGCPKKDTLGICSSKESPDVICCDNFMLSNEYCKACPSGTFGTNCSLECLDGYYGMFCKEKCDCKTSECDKAVGCPQKDPPHLPLTTSNITIAAVSLAITSVVIGVTICVVVRYKSRQQRIYLAPLSSLNEESIGLSRLRENYYSSLIKKSPN